MSVMEDKEIAQDGNNAQLTNTLYKCPISGSLNSFQSTKLSEDTLPLIIDRKVLRWYACGPTVYGPAHLGHARNYVTMDIIRRILTNYFHIEVQLMQNVTDIDDKIIDKANELKISTNVLSRAYEADFFSDMDALNVLRPTKILRATEVIPQIIQFISKLYEGGFAYQLQSEYSVYFDTKEFKNRGFQYPILIQGMKDGEKNKRQLLEEGEGTRSKQSNKQDDQIIEQFQGDQQQQSDKKEKKKWEKPIDAYKNEKRNEDDFALWKQSKPGEPSWQSPWGLGRPGWHIECSAMSHIVFGNHFDIHSGGQDLKFPHHDNEIAQSEAYRECVRKEVEQEEKQGKITQPIPDGKKWVDFWLHTGHLGINGLKMSKSLKNFTSVKDALKEMTSRQMRLIFLQHRYCDCFDFELKSIQEATQIESTVMNFAQNVAVFLRQYNSIVTSIPYSPTIKQVKQFMPPEQLDSIVGKMTEQVGIESKKYTEGDLRVILSYHQVTSLDSLPQEKENQQDREIMMDSDKQGSQSSSSSQTYLPNQYCENQCLDEITTQLNDTQQLIDTAFRNQFDTVQVGRELMRLINAVNRVFKRVKDAEAQSINPLNPSYITPIVLIVKRCAQYLFDIFNIMGIDFGIPQLPLSCGSSGESNQVNEQLEQMTGAFQDMCKFRDQIRQLTMSLPKDDPSKKRLFELSDEIRQKTLPQRGILLEDVGSGQPSVWKTCDPAQIRADQEHAEQLALEAKRKKEEKERVQRETKERQEKAQKEKEELLKYGDIKAQDMFRNEEEEIEVEADQQEQEQEQKGFDDQKTKEKKLIRRPKYTQFDKNGVPTHDANGNQLPTTEFERLKSMWTKQNKKTKKDSKCPKKEEK
ncbi:MAG: putative Cysteine--tRNA ligase [Streblomastix strix]|uniref:cysteine--tRNA ligase n=1 Tax=Streblomastix strix TaxID=222440 RepID=A0A5J4WET3_9EUKA|nr:MAG: putative Cysteine--tRNA ligase [Streblomastix strix]